MKSRDKLKKREKALRRDRAAAAHSLEPAPASASEASQALEPTAAPDTAAAFGRYSAILAEIARSNVAAMGDLFTALIDARSLPEAAAVQADHLRRQVEAVMSQGRDLADLTRTLTLDALAQLTGPIDGDR